MNMYDMVSIPSMSYDINCISVELHKAVVEVSKTGNLSESSVVVICRDVWIAERADGPKVTKRWLML